MTVSELIFALEMYDGDLEVNLDISTEKYDSPNYKVIGVSSTSEMYPDLVECCGNKVVVTFAK